MSAVSLTQVLSGENIRAPSILPAIQRVPSSIFHSSIFLLIPSPHKTGEPISCLLSKINAFAPDFAANLAVTVPAGPLPITITSYFI